MLRSLDQIRGYALIATDGLIGEVNDFFFDDHTWTIRYLVVDTGKWLPGRKVLIASEAVETPLRGDNLQIKLTQQQIKDSPDLASNLPVSRQYEEKLRNYYGWPLYWEAHPTVIAGLEPTVLPTPKTQPNPESITPSKLSGDPHLRSEREVRGYHIAARDGKIGHAEDFIFEDQRWLIRYIVVDTRNWLPGRQVLVALDWVAEIDWSNSQVRVELDRESIKNSPPYDPTTPVNDEYESALYDYYGRPHQP